MGEEKQKQNIPLLPCLKKNEQNQTKPITKQDKNRTKIPKENT